MGDKWLYLATWGDPGSWEPTTYRSVALGRGCPEAGSGSRYGGPESSWTTLPAVLRANPRIGKAIIVIADTLAYARGFEKYVGGCVEEPGICAERYVRRVIEEKGLEIPGREPEVLVAPGLGTYRRMGGETMEYRSYASNYAAYVYSALMEELLAGGYSTLVLDISHGVNYMPVMAYAAAWKAVHAAAAYGGRDMRLAVLESDPVSKENLGEPHRVDLVRCVEVPEKRGVEEAIASLARLAGRQGGLLNQAYKGRPPRDVAELRGILRDAAGRAGVMAGALYFGLPLLALLEASQSRSILCLADAEERVMEASLKALPGAGEGRLVRLLKVGEILLDLLAGMRLACRIAERYSERMVDGGFSLGVLEDFSGAVLPGAARVLALHEAGSMRERLEIYGALCGEPEEWVPYSCIYDLASEKPSSGPWSTLLEAYRSLRKEKERREALEELRELGKGVECRCAENGKCSPDERNFYAHAGMERTMILVARRGEDYLVRYREECVETAKRLAAAPWRKWR